MASAISNLSPLTKNAFSLRIPIDDVRPLVTLPTHIIHCSPIPTDKNEPEAICWNEHEAICYESGYFKIHFDQWTPKERAEGHIRVGLTFQQENGSLGPNYCVQVLPIKQVIDRQIPKSLASLKQTKEALNRSISTSFEDIFRDGPGLIKNHQEAYTSYIKLHREAQRIFDLFRATRILRPPVTSDISPLYESRSEGDITLVAEGQLGTELALSIEPPEPTPYKIHRVALQSSFSGHIGNLLKHGQEKATHEVHFPLADPKTIEKLVYYLYHKNVQVEDEGVARQLLDLARQYSISELEASCLEALAPLDFTRTQPFLLLPFGIVLQVQFSLSGMIDVATTARKCLRLAQERIDPYCHESLLLPPLKKEPYESKESQDNLL